MNKHARKGKENLEIFTPPTQFLVNADLALNIFIQVVQLSLNKKRLPRTSSARARARMQRFAVWERLGSKASVDSNAPRKCRDRCARTNTPNECYARYAWARRANELANLHHVDCEHEHRASRREGVGALVAQHHRPRNHGDHRYEAHDDRRGKRGESLANHRAEGRTVGHETMRQIAHRPGIHRADKARYPRLAHALQKRDQPKRHGRVR